ncbi:hypothetical protein Enr8_28710 [Blastopirellula retiformator]|uniref:Uncharacterized protein n=2 Tax=Blastopirellula retiformator TaxID=2527970 RepID=A0A5C5V3Z0_9BACT|nr:hypothetical protein Enr8_28710 [Blastopirellula retiformator]
MRSEPGEAEKYHDGIFQQAVRRKRRYAAQSQAVHSHPVQVQTSPSQHSQPASHGHSFSHGRFGQAAEVAVNAVSVVISQPHFSHLQSPSHEQLTPSQSGHAQLTHSHFLAVGAASAEAQEIIPNENEKSAAKTIKLFIVSISKRIS